MRTSLHDVVVEQAKARGSSPALTYKSDCWTYADLLERMHWVSDGLLSMGMAREERVAVFLEKRLETVATILGSSAAGCAFVPVNPLLRPQQVSYILADCDVKVLVTSPERYQLLQPELDQCPALEHVVLVASASAAPAPESQADASGATAVRSWTSAFEGRCRRTSPRPVDLDLAAILYTSGSTGRPKGVMLSHRNLIVGAESVSEYLENTPEDVILSVLPLSFDAGLSQVTTAFSAGAHVVLTNYLLPKDVVRLCERHGVTGLTCVPPLWIQIADQTWPESVGKKMRYFANTGGRMPMTTLARLRQHFPAAKPYLMYGLTEAFRSTFLDPAEIDRRPASIGKAIPDAEILVLRPDGSACDPGEEGELVHRGPLVALGYWNDPERSAERFRPVPGRDRELAVWSGDTVVSDDEGFLYFVGRRDEMIKTSGYRVSPTEIEEVAYGTGLVGDAVAVGVEDDTLGQRIILFASSSIGTELDVEALLAAMRRVVPLYMVPSEVLVRDSLPRSPNGKYDRPVLRAEAANAAEVSRSGGSR